MKTYLKPLMFAAVLAAGSAIAAAPQTGSTPAPTPATQTGAHGDHGDHGGDRHGKRGHRGGGRNGALHDLRGLDLSDAQRDSVRAVFEKNRESQTALRQRHRELSTAFDALDPAARDYAARTQTLSDQAAKLAGDELRNRAQVKSQVQALLTSEQIDTLRQKRAERAARRAEFDKGGKPPRRGPAPADKG